MAENSELRTARLEDALALASDTRVLILEAPYYQVVTDHLIAAHPLGHALPGVGRWQKKGSRFFKL